MKLQSKDLIDALAIGQEELSEENSAKRLKKAEPAIGDKIQKIRTNDVKMAKASKAIYKSRDPKK